jgi:hypothetical protein
MLITKPAFIGGSLRFAFKSPIQHSRQQHIQFGASLFLEAAAKLIHFRPGDTVEVGDDAMPSTIGKLMIDFPLASSFCRSAIIRPISRRAQSVLY